VRYTLWMVSANAALGQSAKRRRVPRLAPQLSAAESELLAKINTGVPTELQSRYDALSAKRRAAVLTEAEYDEPAHDVARRGGPVRASYENIRIMPRSG
jgi:hypothetical protein